MNPAGLSENELLWRATAAKFNRSISMKKRPLASAYAERIRNARVYDVAIESPLDYAPRLSKRLRNTVYFKREDL